MDIPQLTSLIKDIGVPFAIVFWILSIGAKNQRDMTRAMDGIQKELSNLACLTHDAITYMKARGGE